MGYISAKEAALRMGISPRRIQQLCQNNQIYGAIRKGRRIQQLCQNNQIYGAIRKGKRWLIPDTISGIYENDTQVETRRSLPIGISDFRNAVTNYYYVDKTRLIKDFLDRKVQVSLFTRPRRFGKTLNMDMLSASSSKSVEKIRVSFFETKIYGLAVKPTENIRVNILLFIFRSKMLSTAPGKMHLQI